MKVTASQLTALLANNPELALVTDGRRTDIVPKAQVGGLSEHQLQAAVIAKCDERAATDPRWKNIFAIPNGGTRDKATGGKLKAEGVRAGVPDLFVAVPSKDGRYAGLFVELKVGRNKPSQVQQEWIERLRANGYAVAVIWDSVDEVLRAIDTYLEDA